MEAPCSRRGDPRQHRLQLRRSGAATRVAARHHASAKIERDTRRHGFLHVAHASPARRQRPRAIAFSTSGGRFGPVARTHEISEPALLSLRSAAAERARDHARSTAARRTCDAVRTPDLEILDVGGILTEGPRHVRAGLPQRRASAWLKPAAGAPPRGLVCGQPARARLEAPASEARELPLVTSSSSRHTRSNGIRKPVIQVRGAAR
jgi:hypothetical protein